MSHNPFIKKHRAKQQTPGCLYPIGRLFVVLVFVWLTLYAFNHVNDLASGLIALLVLRQLYLEVFRANTRRL